MNEMKNVMVSHADCCAYRMKHLRTKEEVVYRVQAAEKKSEKTKENLQRFQGGWSL